MKRLLLATVVLALTLHAEAFTVGTGSSTEVANLTGKVTQVSNSSEVHQGAEVGIATDNLNSGLAEVGKYKSVATSSSTFNGKLDSITTTQKGFSFFDN